MDWNAITAITSAIAALFIGLSVVYLALQIRSGTRATQSQTYYLATTALGEMASIVGRDRELSRVFRIGMENPDALTEDEFTQFGYIGVSLFRRFENVFFQYQSGLIDEDFWIGHRENILWFFHRPGIQRWWQTRRFAFSKRLQEFLDSSRPEDVSSPPTRRL